MDYGYPLTTEPNALKEIIMPPTIMNRMMTTVGAAAGYVDVESNVFKADC